MKTINTDPTSDQHDSVEGFSVDSDLFQSVLQRQRTIISKLPLFTKVSSIAAFMGFALSSIIQYNNGEAPVVKMGLVTIQNPSVGSIISFLLTLFSLIVLWLFVIWSICFIPYIAIQAHRIGLRVPITVATKSFRWLQLYLSSFFPMMVFAVAWSSLTQTTQVMVLISDWRDALLVFFGGALIWLFLSFVLNRIPSRYVTLHVAFFSTLLYISLFITYGFGYGLVAYSTLFGILFYLTFSFNKLEEIGRRMSIFDIDSNVVEDLNSILDKHQVLDIRRAKVQLEEMEMSAQKRENDQDRKLERVKINKHLADLKRSEIGFKATVNSTSLEVFKKKIQYLQDMYEILSKEFDSKVEKSIPKKIDDLKRDVKDFTATDLQESMKRIYEEMNSGLSIIPEALKELRSQIDDAVQQYAMETRRISTQDEEDAISQYLDLHESDAERLRKSGRKNESEPSRNEKKAASSVTDSDSKDRSNCPRCQSQTVVRRVASGIHKDKIYRACSNFPECSFVKLVE